MWCPCPYRISNFVNSFRTQNFCSFEVEMFCDRSKWTYLIFGYETNNSLYSLISFYQTRRIYWRPIFERFSFLLRWHWIVMNRTFICSGNHGFVIWNLQSGGQRLIGYWTSHLDIRTNKTYKKQERNDNSMTHNTTLRTKYICRGY